MKTDAFERVLQRYAYRSGGAVEMAPIEEILKGKELVSCGEGVFHRVSRISKEPWVVKEGRWHLSIPIPQRSWFFPGWLLHGPLRAFGSGCLPTEREIRRQYDHYHTVASYLGAFFGDDQLPSNYPDGEDLIEEQHLIRKRLPSTLKDVEAFYGKSFHRAVGTILDSDVRWHNFLPHEYLLFGKSLDHKRPTSYLFQEFVMGISAHDARQTPFDAHIRAQLVLFCYLVLLLRKETGFVPDTRPRHLWRRTSDWLLDTDNLIIGPRGVTMVDTRWFWEADANIVRRGLGLADLSLQACLRWIETLGK